MDTSDALISEFAVICARADVATADQLLDDAVQVIARFLPSATSVAVLDVPRSASPGCHAVAGTGHELLTAAQVAAHEGPCLEAAASGGVVVVDDLGQDRRWPTFTATMTRTSPARSLLSVAVVDWVVLSAVADEPRALSSHRTLTTALSAASLTAMLLGRVTLEQRAAGLATQLATTTGASHTLALAQGMLMERHGVDAEGADDLLAQVARRESLSTADAAERLVRHRGRCPVTAPTPRRHD